MCFETKCVMALHVHPMSLILAPIESALVISSHLGAILPRFRDIAGFLLRRATPPLFRLKFRGVPLGLDYRCGAPSSEDPKLNISFCELDQPVCSHYRWIDGQTDGQTD